MSLPLDEYRVKLIHKILFAGSQDEVKRYVDAAMKAFEMNKINGYVIARFVDKTIHELELFSPMKEDSQQWSNILMAKVLFHRLRQKKNTIKK